MLIRITWKIVRKKDKGFIYKKSQKEKAVNKSLTKMGGAPSKKVNINDIEKGGKSKSSAAGSG